MTNPTTPFNWQMPTSSDLVTDLPADFETFGQAVATSMADLLGGTTGQILSKASNTDMDFTWVTNDVGDITAVTAGTGLSGGGTSGAVTLSIDTATTVDLTTAQTLTNKTLTSPALTTPTISTLTTNGDLLYGTGSGALARRAIGTSGQVLTVSGGVPTWETPSGGGKVLQVVSDVGSTATTSSTNTYVDISGFSVSITPTATTSKIMVFVSLDWRKTNANADAAADFILVRNGTTILTSNDFTLTEAAEYATACWSINYLDSPSSTSALTYKVQFRSRNNNAAIQAVFLGASSQANITVMEIGA